MNSEKGVQNEECVCATKQIQTTCSASTSIQTLDSSSLKWRWLSNTSRILNVQPFVTLLSTEEADFLHYHTLRANWPCGTQTLLWVGDSVENPSLRFLGSPIPQLCVSGRKRWMCGPRHMISSHKHQQLSGANVESFNKLVRIFKPPLLPIFSE